MVSSLMVMKREASQRKHSQMQCQNSALDVLTKTDVESGSCTSPGLVWRETRAASGARGRVQRPHKSHMAGTGRRVLSRSTSRTFDLNLVFIRARLLLLGRLGAYHTLLLRIISFSGTDGDFRNQPAPPDAPELIAGT
jgi:hypothetical protein